MNNRKCSIAAQVTEAMTQKDSPSPKKKEILVPIDFSVPSVKALRRARELAVEEKAQMILLNVIEEPLSFRTLDAISQQRARYGQRTERLQKLADHELGSQVATHIEVREGNPSAEIMRLARRRCVDLIVVGRHEHRGLRRWIQGHTASRLSKNASCPVLLIEADHLN